MCCNTMNASDCDKGKDFDAKIFYLLSRSQTFMVLRNIRSATIFRLHFFPSCFKAVGLGLKGARQLPVIVRNLTVQGFQAHTCMWRACFHAPGGTILWLKDNSWAFLYPPPTSLTLPRPWSCLFGLPKKDRVLIKQPSLWVIVRFVWLLWGSCSLL